MSRWLLCCTYIDLRWGGTGTGSGPTATLSAVCISRSLIYLVKPSSEASKSLQCGPELLRLLS